MPSIYDNIEKNFSAALNERRLHNDIEDFNKKINTIIGKRIIKVEYFGLNYNNHEKNFLTKFTNVHSVDFSIILYLDNCFSYEITWDSSFFQYGIGISLIRDDIYDDSKIIWNMTKDNLWKRFIQKPIIGVSVLWETVTERKLTQIQSHTYPQTIRIAFDKMEDEIIIGVAEFLNQEENTVMGMMDNLIATNDIKTAVDIKLIDRTHFA